MVWDRLIIIAWLYAFQHGVETYNEGAPVSTCYTMYPKHSGIGQKSGPMPYRLQFEPSSFDPDTIIRVEVNSTTGRQIRGIQMAARRKDGNSEEFVGQFVGFPSNKIKAFNCFGGVRNMVTHKNDHKVTTISFQWKAPKEYVGSVVFWTTIVEDYETFWVAEEATLDANGNHTAVPSKYPEIVTSELDFDMDFGSCGKDSACFLYPSHCHETECIAIARFRANTDGGYKVDLFTKEGPDYVAIGFSHDRKMGDDSTIVCLVSAEVMDVQVGWNPGYYNERQLTRGITMPKVRKKDGEIQCSFDVPDSLPVSIVSQTAVPYQAKDVLFNLNDTWYLMLAWGKTMAGSDVIAEHTALPATTFSKVNLRENKIHYGTAFHVLLKAHASVMIIAWVLFTGLVTVIARHYRDAYPDRRLFGSKLWFQGHRTFATLVAFLTLLGLILVFAHFGSPAIRHKALYHGIVGLTVIACVCLQVIGGFLRPGPSHKRRPLFNWGHWFLGHLTQILSGATIFLAFSMDIITPDLRRLGYITSGVWIGSQIMWHIIFDIHSFCKKRNSDNVTDIDLATGIASVIREWPKSTRLDTILAAVYVLCLLLLSISIMAVFLWY